MLGLTLGPLGPSCGRLWASWRSHGIPHGPRGAPEAPMSPMGPVACPMGNPMGTPQLPSRAPPSREPLGALWAPRGPMGPRGPVACVSRGTHNPQGFCFPERMLLQQNTGILTLDLAKDGSGSTQDPIRPLPRTSSHRNLRRRAHHLPPDPNIFRPQTPNLKIRPLSKFGKSSWVCRCVQARPGLSS